MLPEKIEILDWNEFGFFGHLLDVYRKLFFNSPITSKTRPYGFVFSPYPTATMNCRNDVSLGSSGSVWGRKGVIGGHLYKVWKAYERSRGRGA